MSYAEEIRPPIVESGDEDARYEFRRDVERQRITAEERETMRTMTARLLRANAARPLSEVFEVAEPTPAPSFQASGVLVPLVQTGNAAISDYLSTIGYTPLTRMAPTLADEARAEARNIDQALRAANGRAA